MLSIYVTDALAGVDIRQAYPRFYQRLLREAPLREQFLDMLTILSSDDPPVEQPTCQAQLPKLSLLHMLPPLPLINQSSAQAWRASWYYTPEHGRLQHDAVMRRPTARRSQALQFDDSFLIFNTQISIGGLTLEILLQAVLPPENDDIVPSLEVRCLSEHPLPPNITATIQSDAYSAAARLDSNGRCNFPNVPYNLLCGEADYITCPFHFSLAANS